MKIRFLTGLCALEGKTVYFATPGRTPVRGPDTPTTARTRMLPRRANLAAHRLHLRARPDRAFRGEPLRAELAFNVAEPGGAEPVWPSDHFGVVADLAISERRF